MAEVTSSLPLLQDLIKRDPENYEDEYKTRLEHFEAQLAIFSLHPEESDREFHRLVIFLAQVAPCYSQELGQRFYDTILSLLKDKSHVMHRHTRLALTTALMLIRRRSTVPLIDVLPVYFDVIDSEDKVLRQTVYANIVTDISRCWTRQKNFKEQVEWCDWMIHQLEHPSQTCRRRALAVIMELNRRRVWTSAKAVNAIAQSVLNTDKKTASAAAEFLLGNLAAAEDAIDDIEEDELDSKTIDDMARRITHVKHSKSATKKVERLKKAAERQVKRLRKVKLDNSLSCAVVDQVWDALQLATAVFKRVRKREFSFNTRLLFLQVVSRLIARHKLILLDFYPYMQRFIGPRQDKATKILAIVAEAVTDEVPPQELSSTVRVILDKFVTESMQPEIITVGINTITTIAAKNCNILTADQIEDIMGFTKLHDKNVSAAVKGLVNVYQGENPALLRAAVRSKKARLSLKEGLVPENDFGTDKSQQGMSGLELFLRSECLKQTKEALEEEEAQADTESEDDENETEESEGDDREECDDDDEWEDDDECEENEVGEDQSADLASRKRPASEMMPSPDDLTVDAANAMATRIFTDKEFRQMKRLKLKLDMEQGVGRNCKLSELGEDFYDVSETESDGPGYEEAIDSEDDISEDERNEFKPGRIKVPESVSASDLTRGIKKKRSTQLRIQMKREAKAEGNKFDITHRRMKLTESFAGKSKPEALKRRMKNFSMVRQSSRVQDKLRNRSTTDKITNIRKHRKDAKKAIGGKKKFRRM